MPEFNSKRQQSHVRRPLINSSKIAETEKHKSFTNLADTSSYTAEDPTLFNRTYPSGRSGSWITTSSGSSSSKSSQSADAATPRGTSAEQASSSIQFTHHRSQPLPSSTLFGLKMAGAKRNPTTSTLDDRKESNQGPGNTTQAADQLLEHEQPTAYDNPELMTQVKQGKQVDPNWHLGQDHVARGGTVQDHKLTTKKTQPMFYFSSSPESEEEDRFAERPQYINEAVESTHRGETNTFHTPQEFGMSALFEEEDNGYDTRMYQEDDGSIESQDGSYKDNVQSLTQEHTKTVEPLPYKVQLKEALGKVKNDNIYDISAFLRNTSKLEALPDNPHKYHTTVLADGEHIKIPPGRTLNETLIDMGINPLNSIQEHRARLTSRVMTKPSNANNAESSSDDNTRQDSPIVGNEANTRFKIVAGNNSDDLSSSSTHNLLQHDALAQAQRTFESKLVDRRVRVGNAVMMREDLASGQNTVRGGTAITTSKGASIGRPRKLRRNPPK